jgi:hypothetical protein
MKYYQLDEIPILKSDRVFRVSAAGKAIAAIIIYGIATGFLVMAINGKRLHAPSPFFYCFAAGAGLFGLFPLGMLRASLRRSAWLARFNEEGIIIKYRSYLNWRLPADDVQAVGFAWSEIAWAKLVKERRHTPSMDAKGGSQISWITYIDIALVNPDTSVLESRLQQERGLSPDGVAVSLDYPVRTVPGGIVEISWSGGISPSAHKAISLLGNHVKIAELENRVIDLTHHRGDSPDEQHSKIAQLATSGDKIAAVTLVRETFGCSLTQANALVEKMQSKRQGIGARR